MKRDGLKLNIKKTKIMASSPFTKWQIEGGEVEVVTDFLFLGSKITADSDCSHEIRRCLLLGRKAMTNLDSVLKSRDIARPNKVHIVKAMRNCLKTLMLRKIEGRRRRSNQLIFREINPEYSLEELMLKMKLQLFWSSNMNS